MNLSVLIACHNRKTKTIECLRSLYLAKPKDWNFNIFLVDDGSTDGTAEAVKNFDSKIRIIKGSGNWFWAHSMSQAELAIDKDDDAILWLNDDTLLHQDAFAKVQIIREDHSNSILVGQFSASDGKTLNYGGFSKFGKYPWRLKLAFATDEPIQVDTFNGNFVFIPRQSSAIIGRIDGEYAHAYADLDYGLRAKNLGIEMLLVPGFLGICERNRYQNISNFAEELRNLLNIKSTPIKSQIRFWKKFGGFFYWVFVPLPFLYLIKKRVKIVLSPTNSTQQSKLKC